MSVLLKNWRTTLTGVAVLVLSAGFLMGRLGAHDYITALGALTGTGMLLAKDAHAS
ncbi:MAG TPA: hypothetical protein VMV27_04050 [Candidatus Binataceae bacterium]|nr:hypothetical protein [Candidatus Binataceae bacterium]